MEAFFTGFKTGCAEAWRGYFAPIRLSPWRCAWSAARTPGTCWHAPFAAWFTEVERIVKGQK